jgi:transaldolase
MSVASRVSSPLAAIQALGQSVWLDNISRRMLTTGELLRLISEDDLRGVTSNPTIFDKAISQSADYDDAMKALVKAGADVDAIYHDLTVNDIRDALDLFRPVYDRTKTLDGYVSLEVSPLLARDTAATAREAKHLWEQLDRPNAMIKIPGTTECLDAIEESLFEGINVNVTLLFSVAAYEAVALRYIRALERRVAAGLPIDRVASVASFFVSRIDAEVDKRLDALAKATTDPAVKAELATFAGKIAVDNAKLAYDAFERLFGTPEFAALRTRGARVQRVLWASVGTKNPAYPDTLYIDELIGPDTVSTMPPETLDAVRDHGTAAVTLNQGVADSRQRIARLKELGIDLDDVTTLLLDQGIASFAKSFDALLGGIRTKRDALRQDVAAG